MCKKRARFLGIVKHELATRHLPGNAGIVKIRYTGNKESGVLPASLYFGIRYKYGKGKPPFFVDANDLSRVMSWKENSVPVFEMAG
jgi:hypothetical protein